MAIPSENDANSTPAPSWRTREPDRLAGGTISGRGHALNAHAAWFSAGNRGIHQRGVETSSREQCVAGAEAPAVPVSCRDWERKHRPAARAQAPRTDDDLSSGARARRLRRIARRIHSHHTGAHGATSATASPPLSAPTCYTSRSILAVGAAIPLSRWRDACRRCRPWRPVPLRVQWWSWRLDLEGLWLSPDRSQSMLTTP